MMKRSTHLLLSLGLVMGVGCGDDHGPPLIGDSGDDTAAPQDHCVVPRLSGEVSTSVERWLIGSEGERFGYDLAYAGDQDGDGVDDLIVGAPRRGEGRGAAYVPMSNNAEGGVRANSPRVRIDGPTLQESGQDGDSVSGFGTELADAVHLFDDSTCAAPSLIVGAPFHNVGGQLDIGAIYFIPGCRTTDLDLQRIPEGVLEVPGPETNARWGSEIVTGELHGLNHGDLFLGSIGAASPAGLLFGPIEAQATGALGFQSEEAFWRSDLAPRRGAFADIDGDGQTELIIGDLQGDHDGLDDAGAVHVLRWRDRGTSSSSWEVALTVRGDVAEGRFGSALDAGDFDGDGLQDVLVGAPGNTASDSDYAGAGWILYGSELSARLGQSTPAYARDFAPVLEGERGADRAGSRVEAMPDQDGDGRDEIVVSTNPRWQDAGSAAHKVYLIYGAETQRPMSLDDADAYITGYGYFGYALAAVGDVTGDGCADLAIGAPYLEHEEAGEEAGGVYLLSFAEAAAAQAEFNGEEE